NVPALTEELWALHFSGKDDALQQIETLLLDHTEHQIREIRLAFSDFPATLVARDIRRSLSPWNTPIKREEEIEVVEFDSAEDKIQKRQQDSIADEEFDDEEEDEFKPLYDIPGIHYALEGRTYLEVARIEQVYNDLYEYEDKQSLQQRIKDELPEEVQESLFDRLQGVQLEQIAAGVIKILAAYNKSIPDTPPPPATTEPLPKILPKYRKITWKRHLYVLGHSPRDAEIEGYQEISKHTALLSRDEFTKLRDLIHQTIGYQLDLRLYPQGVDFSAARTTWRIQDALEREEPFDDIIEALYGLSPSETASVRRSFEAITGVRLKDALSQKIIGDEYDIVAEFQRGLLHRRLYATPRAVYRTDILAHFNEGGHGASDARVASKTLAALKDNGIINYQELKQFLAPLTPRERSLVEDLYFQRHSKSLRHELEKSLSKAEMDCAISLLLGTDIDELLTLLQKSPEQLANQYQLSSLELRTLTEEFARRTNSNSDALLEFYLELSKHSTRPEHSSGAEALMLLTRNSVQTLRDLLRQKAIKKSVEESEIVGLLEHTFLHSLAIERTYCWRFGSLRQHLKALLSGGLISPETYCSCIFRLEGIPQEILDDMEIAISEDDDEDLKEIFMELGSHCRTVEECFPLENGEQSLTAALADMELSTPRINTLSLYFLGFYPDKVAEKVAEAIQSSTAHEREKRLQEIFIDPFEEGAQNPLLPADFNWITEMYILIRREYQERYGVPLLQAFLKAGIPEEYIDKIKVQLFGTDMVGVVEELIRARDGLLPVDAPTFIVRELEKFPYRYIEGVIELFEALRPGVSLLEEISNSKGENVGEAMSILNPPKKKKKSSTQDAE
ncbi:MAG: hypothetical protein KDD70_14080, partial [Bdellovibrionales bacterium]|nr:hypothetical protein [Bdellovibrionales bacterium]